MAEKHKVQFHMGVETEDKITVFIPPSEIEFPKLKGVYPVEVLTSEMVIVLRIMLPEVKYLATNVNLKAAIQEGKKEIWISYLDPTHGYVMDAARLQVVSVY